MGQALNMAAGLDAYLLADRGTWLAFGNRGGLRLLVEGDPRMFNPYGVLVVNPARHPHVKHLPAQQLADWLTGPAGQAAIASFKVAGLPLFFPNAGDSGGPSR
jgi:tungstate transport system substrate-binding protein